MHGGRLAAENVRLAHRVCNQRDYVWRVRINAMLAKRMSLEEIAKELNERKVPAIHGTSGRLPQFGRHSGHLLTMYAASASKAPLVRPEKDSDTGPRREGGGPETAAFRVLPLRDQGHVGRLGALRAFLLLERDPRALGERLVALAADGAVVHEQVLRCPHQE